MLCYVEYLAEFQSILQVAVLFTGFWIMIGWVEIISMGYFELW